MNKTISFVISFSMAVLIFSSDSRAYASDEEMWQKLAAGGLVVLMRHASTNSGNASGNPLLRDPSCSAERNLSAQGKEEAAHIGRMFKSKGIPVGAVLASPYCRTVETATIAFGSVKSTPYLSLLEVLSANQAETASAQLVQKIGSYKGEKNLILVTHAPNIDAVAFDPVEKAAFLVLKPLGNDEFDELGKINLFK
jgi:phosphohistidine phosphatase SixA